MLLISLKAIRHSDTITELNSDGSLSGFPQKYSPAFFDKESWVLSIKNKKYKFPVCIAKALKNVERENIVLTSS